MRMHCSNGGVVAPDRASLRDETSFPPPWIRVGSRARIEDKSR